MRLLVTGAGGFLGRYVVAEAIRAGHDVCALLRPAGDVPDTSWLDHPRLRIARADLRRRMGLSTILAGMDTVLHVAAAKTGDVYAQFAGTVVATENLLAAMDQASVGKIVAVSSLSVYDYRANRLFSPLDETSPLERTPFARDGYTQAKLAQEKLIRTYAMAAGWDFAILRPGAIFGPGNLLPARAGMQIGDSCIVRLGGFAPLPLVYVENCAAAIVLGAEKSDRTGPVFNLIDDARPTQRQYVRMLQRRLSPRPRVVPVPWALLQSAAFGVAICNKLIFSGRAKIPGLLMPARLAARIDPFRYDNRKSKEILGWSPRFTLAEALDRSVAGASASVPIERVGKGGGMNATVNRIAYMTGEYPRATDTFIQREIAALRKLGMQVQTFAVRKPVASLIKNDAQAAESAATRYLLPAGASELLQSHAGAFVRNPRRYFRALRLAISTRAPGFVRAVKQLAYFAEAGVLADQMRRRNLAHLHNHFSNSSCSVAMLAAEMGGFTYSFTMHGPSEFFEPREFAVGEKIHRARFVACISYFCRSQAMLFARPSDWEKLKIVHCGVELDPRLAGGASPPRPGGQDNGGHGPPAKREKRRLLFVGRLAAVKGLPILLDAFAMLTQRFGLELLLAGDGPDRRALMARCEQLNIADRVTFLGYQSPAQVQQLLQEADLFVLPSFAEGVPVVLMEAMGAGVPVVATRIAGIPELVDHERTGLLAPPGDAGLLAGQVARLLDDRRLADELAIAAKRKVAAEFDVNIEARRLFELFSHCLHREPIDRTKDWLRGEIPRGQGCRTPLVTT